MPANCTTGSATNKPAPSQQRRHRSDEKRQAIAAARKRLANAFGKFNPKAPTPTLVSLRLHAGLSQAELAQLLGTAQSGIARMEKRPGDLALSRLTQLSAAFNCDINTIAQAVHNTNTLSKANTA